MNQQQVIEFLNSREGATDAAVITTYRVYIDSREVNVEVHDHGSGAGDYRFSVLAEWSERSDQEVISGKGHVFTNPAATLQEALGDVHWHSFLIHD